jgi:hypothetical protein
MRQSDRVQEEASGTEPKFYLPAGSVSPLLSGLVESVWSTLFAHGVDEPGSRSR